MDLPEQDITLQEALVELVFAITNYKGSDAEKRAAAKVKIAIERNHAKKAHIQQFYVVLNSLLTEFRSKSDFVASKTPDLFGQPSKNNNKSPKPPMTVLNDLKLFC
ncbi:MAG: hypothetical protein EP298_03305 [Gammaproteobacteria bacterium]|nr:MAG: hypothetical protein EP298_03305 [Gammaproteobacteria bacterium]UTW43546.1 hypothetical protein KFE69_05505 [bacterium SCSIO 12844]